MKNPALLSSDQDNTTKLLSEKIRTETVLKNHQLYEQVKQWTVLSCFMKLDTINVQLVVCEIKIDSIDICDVEAFTDSTHLIFQIAIKE